MGRDQVRAKVSQDLIVVEEGPLQLEAPHLAMQISYGASTAPNLLSCHGINAMLQLLSLFPR
jgi:hypothetical protein